MALRMFYGESKQMRLSVDSCGERPLFNEQVKVRAHSVPPAGGEHGVATENQSVKRHDVIERPREQMERRGVIFRQVGHRES